MKKITPKKYAQALAQVLVTKKGQDQIDPVLQKFAQILVSNQDSSQLESIIKEFPKTWEQEKKIVTSRVVSAQKLDLDIIKALKTIIKDFSGKREVDIVNQVDPSILGGVIIHYQDKKIDSSLKTKINQLKESFYN